MTSIVMVTASGEEHGLVKKVANSVPDNGFAHMDPATKAKAEKLRKEEARMVKARYINHRGENERLTKPYCRWAGDPICTYHLIPGYTYDLPLGFINEVNGSPGLARRGERVEEGKVIAQDQAPEKLHELVGVGFN